jgi:hypothetical protein
VLSRLVVGSSWLLALEVRSTSPDGSRKCALAPEPPHAKNQDRYRTLRARAHTTTKDKRKEKERKKSVAAASGTDRKLTKWAETENEGFGWTLPRGAPVSCTPDMRMQGKTSVRCKYVKKKVVATT